nr:OmpA family protein [Gammaproteobacteria bacterium]
PAGWRVDSSGCASKLSLRNINFELDSAALTARSQDMLTSRVIPALQTRPGTRMRIEGHTDSTGSAQYNLGLSQRRANAVKAYLESKGIGQGRLSAVGKGEAEPAVSNKTREGRATNRRVEFHVLN